MLKDISKDKIGLLSKSSQSLLNLFSDLIREGMKKDIFIKEDPNILAMTFWGISSGVVLFDDSSLYKKDRRKYMRIKLNAAFRCFHTGISKGCKNAIKS